MTVDGQVDTGTLSVVAGAYANTPGERAAAVLQVCALARDADDARVVMAALGLDPREGRQAGGPRSPRVPGSTTRRGSAA